MTVEEFAQVAQSLRLKLVQLTMVRGHERDDADDIVQESIINALGSATKCKTKSDVERLLRTISFRLSANWHEAKRFRSSVTQRLDDFSEDGEAQDNLSHDDNAQQRDLKLDVQRALGKLNEEDRELARLLLIEGWTYEEVLPLYSDRFNTKTPLYQHVQSHVVPVLRHELAAYKGGI